MNTEHKTFDVTTSMMNEHRTYKMITLVLVGAGVYQVIAALLALFFWLLAGDWHPFWPHIAGIAFWLDLPASYWLWRAYWRAKTLRR